VRPDGTTAIADEAGDRARSLELVREGARAVALGLTPATGATIIVAPVQNSIRTPAWTGL
jgi:hypothetical protein